MYLTDQIHHVFDPPFSENHRFLADRGQPQNGMHKSGRYLNG